MWVDLGCGSRKPPGFIGLDIGVGKSADIVCDLNDGIPLRDNTVDRLRCQDFLEHLDPHNKIMIGEEAWRVLKPDGIWESVTPSADGPAAYGDPTHYSFWNYLSFHYYAHDQCRKHYDIKAKFEILELFHAYIGEWWKARDGFHVLCRMRAIKNA